MLKESLTVLAATRPPTYRTVRVQDQIAALESDLGLTVATPIRGLHKASYRLRELRTLAAERKATPAATPASKEDPLARSARVIAEARKLLATHTAPTKAAAQPAAAALPTAPTEIAPSALSALTVHIFGPGAASDYEGQRLAFTRAGLHVPGLAPAPENPHFTQRFVGLARSVRADRQHKIDAFFNQKH